ncbi:MAG: hypothetical protein GY859_43670, partial [Desulfobacterales bacterium]|nr:hypothetical protein [Desulfobacterales bacterium]
MKKNRTNKKRMIVILLVLITGAGAGAAVGAFFALTHDLPQIRELQTFKPSAVTRIYSVDNHLLAELFQEKRDPVPLDAIPDYLKQALVATEDRKFYNHGGVDVKGVMRALIKDIMAGKYVEGASTITQQLAKTLFLSPKKTITRKIREAFLAFQLERRYTKNEILAFYLNQIYLGSGAYGVSAAAKTFFGKELSELDLSECALIAAMPKAPSRFSPLVNPKLAIQRRNIVLRQMRLTDIISRDQYDAAVNAPLKLAEKKARSIQASYFVDYVKRL